MFDQQDGNMHYPSRRRRMKCIISLLSCGFIPAVGSCQQQQARLAAQGARNFSLRWAP